MLQNAVLQRSNGQNQPQNQRPIKNGSSSDRAAWPAPESSSGFSMGRAVMPSKNHKIPDQHKGLGKHAPFFCATVFFSF